MKYKNSLLILSLVVAGCMLSRPAHAQDHTAAIAAADTAHFSVNKAEGWQLFNSYMAARTGDSVLLELILQHAHTIDWKQEQLVGKIKTGSFQPKTDRAIPFLLAGSSYALRIDKNGKCYLRLAAGALPPAGPVVIPLAVKFKK